MKKEVVSVDALVKTVEKEEVHRIMVPKRENYNLEEVTSIAGMVKNKGHFFF